MKKWRKLVIVRHSKLVFVGTLVEVNIGQMKLKKIMYRNNLFLNLNEGTNLAKFVFSVIYNYILFIATKYFQSE